MSPLISPAQLPTAAATVVVSIGVAAVYGFVGYRLAQRPVSTVSRLASLQFAVWWIGLGASVLLTGIEVTLAALNVLSFPLELTLSLVGVIVACVFLWALIGFLTFVYTGRYHLWELSIFYAVFFVLVLYYFLAQDPYGIVVKAGVPTLVYSVPGILWLAIVVVVGLVLPIIIGAALYLSLLRRTHDRGQRYRIALVGGAIVLWIVLDVFFPSSTAGWVLLRGALEVVPGLMSLIAFFPPDWAQRRYGAAAAEAPEAERSERISADP